MISNTFGKIFKRKDKELSSKDDVKQRLKLVLEHDRLSLDAYTLKKIREEILHVVSKYLELDTESLECSVETNNTMTALKANLPIRKIRRNLG